MGCSAKRRVVSPSSLTKTNVRVQSKSSCAAKVELEQEARDAPHRVAHVTEQNEARLVAALRAARQHERHAAGARRAPERGMRVDASFAQSTTSHALSAAQPLDERPHGTTYFLDLDVVERSERRAQEVLASRSIGITSRERRADEAANVLGSALNLATQRRDERIRALGAHRIDEPDPKARELVLNAPRPHVLEQAMRVEPRLQRALHAIEHLRAARQLQQAIELGPAMHERPQRAVGGRRRERIEQLAQRVELGIVEAVVGEALPERAPWRA